jgi:hypothetical protein
MALHHDIYWVGKQWAVTGYGVQACNQKQKGKFDIEGARLWEEGVLETIRAEAWLNVEDFDKALAVARKYYPEPPQKAAPPAQAQRPAPRAKTSVKAARPQEIPVQPPPPSALKFAMHIESWPAKFVRPWRIRFTR